MVAELLSFLRPTPGGHYADASCGHGHFAERLVQCLLPDGRLLCVDVDYEAITATTRRLARFGRSCVVCRGSYSDLASLAAEAGLGPFAGIVIDGGCVSREQLMNPALGLSFQVDGELNMKLRPELPGPTAREIIATLSVRELSKLFQGAGESPVMARRFAMAIAHARSRRPITRTKELAAIVEEAARASPFRRGKRHPATRVFLALRAAVNQELPTLEQGLHAAVACLAPYGRLCVLTYYGDEHALVRRSFATMERGCVCPPGLPVCSCGREPSVRRLLHTPLSPSPREVSANDSARSARLHVVERLPAVKQEVF